MPPSPKTTLRIAMAMRGGVSLAVWIGGAVYEIDELRRDLDRRTPTTTLGRLAKALGFAKVEIDIMAGTSAGGINGVMLGTGLAHGHPLDDIKKLWVDAGSIDKLLERDSGAPHRSILNSTYFGDQLAGAFQGLIDDPTDRADAQETHDVDVFLPVTSTVPAAISAATDPNSPARETHAGGVVHLQHRKRKARTGTRARNDFTNAQNLADAARSTASFPVAFEPVHASDWLRAHVQFPGPTPNPLPLFDGGVLDNLPLGHALRAIDNSPASGRTKRVFLYLHPNPTDLRSATPTVANDHPGPMRVLGTVMSAKMHESLVDDLRAIDDHNRFVASTKAERDQLLADPVVSAAEGRAIAHVHDAERIVDLLTNPDAHVELGTDVPIITDGMSTDRIADLAVAVTTAIAAAKLPPAPAHMPALASGSYRPWAPVVRMASYLIERSRELQEDNPASTAVLSSRKERLYGIRQLALDAGSKMNVATLAGLPVERPITDTDAFAKAVVAARAKLVLADLRSVVAQWKALGALAKSIAAESDAKPNGDAKANDVATPRDMTGLNKVDAALLPLHRGQAFGAPDVIKFFTVSGAGGTPLLKSALSPVSAIWPRFETLQLMQTDAPAIEPPRIDPASKLAGSRVGSFSGFLVDAWRASDWMWGRIDASTALTRMLIECASDDDKEPDRLQPGAAIDDLLRVKQDAARPGAAELDAAAAEEWPDATKAARAKQLDTTWKTEAPPMVLRRAHAEIAAQELSGPAKYNPTGADGKATLAAQAKAWDDAPRSLDDRWGKPEFASMVMRAARSALLAFEHDVSRFARVGVRVLWALLAPVLSFVVERRRGAALVSIFIGGAVLPRLNHRTALPWVVWGLTVVLVGFWVVKAKRTKPPTGAAGAWPAIKRFVQPQPWSLLITLVMFGLMGWEVYKFGHGDLARYLPPKGANNGLSHYELPVASIIVGGLIGMWWAKWWARILVPLASGGVVGFWVWLGGHSTRAKACCVLGPVLNGFGSFWWAVIVVVTGTSVLMHAIDIAREPNQS